MIWWTLLASSKKFSCIHRWQNCYTVIASDSWEVGSVSSIPIFPMCCKFLMCPCMNSPTAVFFDIWTLPISGDCVCPDYKFSSLFISLQEQQLERLRLIHGNLPSSCFPSNAASSLQKAQCTKSPLQSLPHRDEELLGPISSPSPISAGLVLSTPTCNTHTSMLNNKNIIQKEWILPSGISELKKIKNKKNIPHKLF